MAKRKQGTKANQVDTLYTATRPIDTIAVGTNDPSLAAAMLLGAVNEMMQEVKDKMDKAGHAPNRTLLPRIFITFQATGGKHYVD